MSMYPSNIKSAFLWNQQVGVDAVLLDVSGSNFCIYGAWISRDNDMTFAVDRATAMARIYQLDSGETLVALPQVNIGGPFFIDRPYIGFDVGDDLYATVLDPVGSTGIDGGHDTGNYQFEVLYTEEPCASFSSGYDLYFGFGFFLIIFFWLVWLFRTKRSTMN